MARKMGWKTQGCALHDGAAGKVRRWLENQPDQGANTQKIAPDRNLAVQALRRCEERSTSEPGAISCLTALLSGSTTMRMASPTRYSAGWWKVVSS